MTNNANSKNDSFNTKEFSSAKKRKVSKKKKKTS